MTAYVWISIVVGVILLTTLWNIFNKGLSEIVFPETKNALQNENSTIAEKSYDTLTKLETFWNYFLLLPLFGLVFWGFVKAQKKRGFQV